MIAVQEGSDRWQIARDKDTRVTGDLKVGAKVTIETNMTASLRWKSRKKRKRNNLQAWLG